VFTDSPVQLACTTSRTKSLTTSRTMFVAAALLALAGPGVAAAAPSDVIAPINPSASAPPPASPAATVSASCIVSGSTTDTIWFGYTNTSPERVNALIGGSNFVTVNVPGVSINQGQIEQLLVGTVERAFAVTIAKGATASWNVDVPNLAAPGFTTRVSAASSSLTPACATGAGTRSASIQAIPGQFPGITATAAKQTRNVAGLLTRASVNFQINGLQTVCSSGGTPLEPKVLWGYGGPTSQISGALLRGTGDALRAVPANAVVRVDADSNYSFTRTYRSARAIVDPQKLWVFGTLAQQIQGTAPYAYGLSSETVIADVVGRCAFGSRVVQSATTYWLDANGRPIGLMVVTDQATQVTRPVQGCIFTGTLVPNCDIPIIGVGPGGPRFR
jgi:hypothetical protein